MKDKVAIVTGGTGALGRVISTRLADEGIKKPQEVILCGDVMQDAAGYYAPLAGKKSSIITKLNLKSFVLCTIHREENTNDTMRLKSIINAINKINCL